MRSRSGRAGDGLVDRLVDPRYFGPLLLLLAAAISYWYASRGLPFQDEGSTLTAAAKILRGDIFYRDIDSYPFPGAPYILAFFMSIFGEHLSVARTLAGIAYCASLLALYLTALGLMDHTRAALFGLLLLCFKFLAWPAFSVYFYADLAFCFACVAIYLYMGRKEGRGGIRFVAVGACAAFSVLCKQNMGIYLGGALTLLLAGPPLLQRKRSAPAERAWEPFLAFVLGAAIPLGATAVYFAAHGLLGSLIHSGLIRPFTGYLPTSSIAFTPMLAWWNLGEIDWRSGAHYLSPDYYKMLQWGQLPIKGLYGFYWLFGEVVSRALYTAVVGAYVWLGARVLWARGRAGGHGLDPKLLAFALLSVALLGSAFPRADFFHIISVFPPILLLLFALAQPETLTARRPRLLAAAVAFSLVVCGSLAAFHRSTLTYHIRLERAEVDIDPSQAWMETLVKVISSELGPNEPFFVYGHESQFYFLTDRFYPWPFSQLYPGMLGGDGGEALAARLAAEPPRYVFQGIIDWQGLPPIPEHAPKLAREIARSYRRDTLFFDRHGLPPGAETPEARFAQILRPRPVPLVPSRSHP